MSDERDRILPASLAVLIALACTTSDSASRRVAASSRTGAYTGAQASRGRAVYAQHCATCHGARLEGGGGPALAGTAFLRARAGPALTADDLYFIIRTTMPSGSVGRLTRQEYLDVVAYILAENEYPPGTSELTEEPRVLRAIRLGPAPGSVAAVVPRPNDADPTARPLLPTASRPTQAELDGAAEADEWLAPEHDYAGTKYSPLRQITPANASRLRPVCLYQVGETGSFQAMPIVHRGILYLTTARLTIALDARTCRLRWKHDWPEEGTERWPRNRGAAIKDGRIVRGTTDGQLIALDAITGTLLWARRVADQSVGETFTMPPLIYDSLVLIGPGLGERGISGWIGAFRLTDGARVWRFETVRKDSTWRAGDSVVVGGAAVWTPPTLDRAAGTLYVATGNPIPDFAGDVRQGDNLYSNSLLALDVHSGTLRWFRQMVPHDTHDWDLTHAGPLFRARVRGALRDAIATAGKDGMLRVLDRRTHEVLYQVAVTTRENVDAPITRTGTRACPGFWGGVQWNGPAYHPRLQTLFVNAADWCTTYTLGTRLRHMPGRGHLGGTGVDDSTTKAAGWLTAVDATTGGIRWRYRSPAPLIAGIAATAGDLLFTGELTGDFIVLDARTGAVLYRFNTGGPIGGGVISYAVGRTQYVAVMSGRPSRFSVGRDPGAPTVLVFGLP
jgi:alcohol dehydrogenase (cytochrome c)